MGTLDLKVVQYTWTNEYGFNGHDIEATFSVNNRIAKGRGFGHSHEIALAKALSEAVEDAISWEMHIPLRWGKACHPIAADASQLALREGLERDLFFCHYLSEMPFRQVPLNAWPWLEQLSFACEQKGLQFKVGEMFPFEGWKFTLALVLGKSSATPFGVTLGLGSGFSIEQSAFHALVEAFRNAAAQIAGTGESSISLEDFDKIARSTPNLTL